MWNVQHLDGRLGWPDPISEAQAKRLCTQLNCLSSGWAVVPHIEPPDDSAVVAEITAAIKRMLQPIGSYVPPYSR